MDDIVEELSKLQRLLDAGTITHDEFATLKAELMATHAHAAAHDIPPPPTTPPGAIPGASLPPAPPALPSPATPSISTLPPAPTTGAAHGPFAGFGTPPAPPTSSKKWIVAVIGVVALVAIVAFTTRDRWGGPGTITVDYTIEVVSDSYCADFGNTGYDDIPYAEAELLDGSGTLLGFGTLDGGVDTDTSCVFHARFTADATSDGTYRITAGNANRGYLNYSPSDVVDGVLTVDAIID